MRSPKTTRFSLGGFTMIELMMVVSDNTACDVVLKLVGGPSVVERRIRALGFPSINVNR